MEIWRLSPHYSYPTTAVAVLWGWPAPALGVATWHMKFQCRSGLACPGLCCNGSAILCDRLQCLEEGAKPSQQEPPPLLVLYNAVIFHKCKIYGSVVIPPPPPCICLVYLDNIVSLFSCVPPSACIHLLSLLLC